MTSSTLMRIWLAAAAISLLLSAAAVAQPPAGPYLNAAPPPGMARIWFFRDLNPNETLAMAYIRLNGAVAGVSTAGGAFYRDVAPGRYHIRQLCRGSAQRSGCRARARDGGLCQGCCHSMISCRVAAGKAAAVIVATPLSY